MKDLNSKIRTFVIELGSEMVTQRLVRGLGVDRSDITLKYDKKLRKLIKEYIDFKSKENL